MESIEFKLLYISPYAKKLGRFLRQSLLVCSRLRRISLASRSHPIQILQTHLVTGNVSLVFRKAKNAFRNLT